MPYAPVLIPIAPLAVALLLFLLVRTWDSTVGPIMQAIANALDISIPTPSRFIPDIHLGAAASAVRRADAFIRRKLGELLTVAAWPLAALLTFAARLFLDPARELAYLTRDVTATIYALRKYVVPAMIAAKVAWIPRHLVALEREVASLAHRAPLHIVKDITNVAKHYSTTVVHKTVGATLPRVRTLEREVDALKKKVGSTVRRAPVALTAAALTAIVARTSFRWVRCSRVQKFGRGVCGMNDTALDNLLADVALITFTINIREFARGMQAGIDDVIPQIRHFWKV